MKKQILLIMCMMFLLSFSYAQINDYGSVQREDCILLKQSCASCSWVNISVIYENETVLDNVLMISSGAVWTYEFCNTSRQGRYDVLGAGDLQGTPTSFDALYFDVNEYGINAFTFGFYAFLYSFLLFLSYFFVYKFATYNGGKVRDYNFYFWSAFLSLVLYVIIEINGFGGVDTLIVDIIKMLCFGSGVYFLVQGIIYAVSWQSKNYR